MEHLLIIAAAILIAWIVYKYNAEICKKDKLSREWEWLIFAGLIGFSIILFWIPQWLKSKVISADWILGMKPHEIGDAIGGMTAPFVGMVAAWLVYIAFRAQINANKRIESLEKKNIFFTAISTIDNLSQTIDKSLNDITETIWDDNNLRLFMKNKHNLDENNKSMKTHQVIKSCYEEIIKQNPPFEKQHSHINNIVELFFEMSFYLKSFFSLDEEIIGRIFISSKIDELNKTVVGIVSILLQNDKKGIRPDHSDSYIYLEYCETVLKWNLILNAEYKKDLQNYINFCKR